MFQGSGAEMQSVEINDFGSIPSGNPGPPIDLFASVIYFDAGYVAKCYPNEPGADRVRQVAYGAAGLAPRSTST